MRNPNKIDKISKLELVIVKYIKNNVLFNNHLRLVSNDEECQLIEKIDKLYKKSIIVKKVNSSYIRRLFRLATELIIKEQNEVEQKRLFNHISKNN